MPIDKRQSHANIVKELLDEYKKSGKIGNTHPRDLEHATSIANAIAYKTKQESRDLRLLTAIKNVNKQEAQQLSLLNANHNIDYFLHDLNKKNWQEVHYCVEIAYAQYMKHAKAILKKWDLTEVQFNTHKFLAELEFDNSCMMLDNIFEDQDSLVVYKQYIGSRLEVAIQSACAKARTKNFICKYDDSGSFYVCITKEYKKYILDQMMKLSNV